MLPTALYPVDMYRVVLWGMEEEVWGLFFSYGLLETLKNYEGYCASVELIL